MGVPTFALLALAGAGVLGCAGGGVSMRGVHPAGLQAATNAMGVAFHHNQIPVQVLDDAAGYVASGGFQLEGVWGTGAVEERVDCGVMADGTPRARLGVVWMSVEAELRPTSDALATARAGASVARRPTEVYLKSRGDVRIEDETHGCGLKETFVRQVLAAAGVQDGGIIDVPRDGRVIADVGQ